MSDVRLAVIQDSPAGEVVRAFLTEHPEFVRGGAPPASGAGAKHLDQLTKVSKSDRL